MVAVAQGPNRGLHDIGRCREIRLADAKIDDVLALRREFAGSGQNGEGVFLAYAVKSRNGLHKKSFQ